MSEATPRLLWLNGPHYVGKRTLAGRLRDEWSAVVLDAEAIGFTLQEGMPTALAPSDLQDNSIWHWSLWRLSLELARAFQFAVLAGTVYRPETVAEMLGRFSQAGVDVLHMVMDADEIALRARIHGHDVDRDAKRWALEHLRPARDGLRETSGLRLDTTSRAPDQLPSDLARLLVHHGWLTPDGTWTPPTQAASAR